jgi:AraC family transcriptional regulator of adaptative response/methylated-DNA-[protein]-cysteine methyltransferase
LSSASRVYDHFVHIEAVTPGEFKSGGHGLTIDYAMHDTPFGTAFIASTPRGICNFAFVPSTDITDPLDEIRKRWPHAVLNENPQRTQAIIQSLFASNTKPDRPLSLHVLGTNFQINVWKALLQIPPATVTSYTNVANALGRPNSARAVGTAIGANPIAFLIPCHRVIQQSGRLGGYHWGETRKHAIHAWEAARYD